MDYHQLFEILPKGLNAKAKKYLLIMITVCPFPLLVIFGSWFDHVKGWLSAGDKHPIMYISYEEMIMVSLYILL